MAELPPERPPEPAGPSQVDELLATKLRGSGLEEHVEVVARIDAEREQRLLPVFRI